MDAIGILVSGQKTVIPGVYPEVNVSGMTPVNTGQSAVLGVIGTSDGGLPGTVYRFGSYEDAAAVLRGGRILSYIARMFQPCPSPDLNGTRLNGAAQIVFIRGNPSAAQASLDMDSATWTVTARDAGAWTNGIRIGVAINASPDTLVTDYSGSPTYYHVPTLTVESVPDKQTYSYAFRNGLTVTAPSGSTVTIDHSTLTITLATNATLVEAIEFSQVPTFADLVSWINQHTGWVATCIGASYLPTATLNDNAAAAPTVSTQAIFFPAEEALAAYLLSTQCPVVTASYPATPTSLQALSTTYLAGGRGRGTDTMTTGALTAALTIAETVSLVGIWAQSSAPALQALLISHCATMSTDIRRKYRWAAMGINFAATSPVDAPVAGASSLDNAIVIAAAALPALDGPGFFCLNGSAWTNPITGVQEQLGGLGVAAQLAGMKAGNYLSIPLTNKTVNATALEFPVVTDDQKTAALNAGITMLIHDDEEGRTKILQALTTRQSTNPMLRTLHGLGIVHQIARMEIAVLSAKYIGSSLDLGTGNLIKQDMAKALDKVVLSGSNPAGYLTEGRLANGTRVPAWESLSVSGDSTTNTWRISVNPHPVTETDFIQVINNLSPAPIEL